MSIFLNILAPATGGAIGVLTMAYVLADQFVVDVPAPVRGAMIGQAVAQDATPQVVPTEVSATVSPVAVLSFPSGGYGIGRAAHSEEVAAWDIDVRPDGQGLPEGRGDVWTGEEVYVENCAMCHGDFGEAVGRWPVLAGGHNTLDREDPVKTIGSYWPYLSTVFDYVNRAMPFGNAQSLTPDEVYAITAYLLNVNDLVEDDFELSHENFADVRLPNEGNFFMDDRPEAELAVFTREPCMENCKDTVEITMHASVLDVTPQDTADEAASAAQEEPAQVAAPEVDADADAAAPAATVDVAALDPALVAEGETVFRKCSACHQVGEGAVNRVGPHLNDVFGRAAGGLEDFRYSSVMADAGASGMVWNDETMAGFLADPRGYMRGTKMSFAGLRAEAEIAAVSTYLKSMGE